MPQSRGSGSAPKDRRGGVRARRDAASGLLPHLSKAVIIGAASPLSRLPLSREAEARNFTLTAAA